MIIIQDKGKIFTVSGSYEMTIYEIIIALGHKGDILVSYPENSSYILEQRAYEVHDSQINMYIPNTDEDESDESDEDEADEDEAESESELESDDDYVHLEFINI